jgi:AAA family ATP:ADP antiporter
MSNENVSKLRKMLWPIYGEENWKFIPMLVMLGLSLFNYTSLRISKDALIVTAPGSGAAVLSFLKGYIVMPASILFVIFYGAMSNRFDKKNLFYVALAPFLAFFVVFALLIYPFSHVVHGSPEWVFSMQAYYPRLKHIIPIFAYWGYSAFYVFTELWGNVMITLLFWQFANLNVSAAEVKRFYPSFGVLSNLGLIIAGVIQYFGTTTELTCFFVVTSGIMIAILHWWMYAYVLPQEPVVDAANKPKRAKLSIKESARLIFNSKYLGLIAVLVLAYGMTANLVEMTWKQSVKELYPNKMEYQKFMGKFFVATGVSTMIIGFFVKNVVQNFGWLTASLITPAIMLTTSILFYGFILYADYLLPASMLIGTLPLQIAVIIGAIQNIASKGTKYSLFDPTTQMTYKPLSDDLQTKGKAAVDVIGGRLGKSMGGYVQSIALVVTGGTQLSIAPLLLVCVVIVSIAWIFSVFSLNKEYTTLLEEKEKQI